MLWVVLLILFLVLAGQLIGVGAVYMYRSKKHGKESAKECEKEKEC